MSYLFVSSLGLQDYVVYLGTSDLSQRSQLGVVTTTHLALPVGKPWTNSSSKPNFKHPKIDPTFDGQPTSIYPLVFPNIAGISPLSIGKSSSNQRGLHFPACDFVIVDPRVYTFFFKHDDFEIPTCNKGIPQQKCCLVRESLPKQIPSIQV